MLVSGVTKDDALKLGQLINMLHVGEFELNGKDICASADTIRWLQNLAKQTAEVYAREQNPVPPETTVAPGIKVKTMGKGKV